MKSITEFLSRHITSDGVWITGWEGGDLKWLCKKAGLSGNFATHDQCLWCEVPRNQLGSLKRYPERTVNSIRVLAHMHPLAEDGTLIYPFTCECCQKTFESEDDCAAEILSPDVIKSYPTIHKGVLWHKGPITSTPINRMVPCVLHMRLRCAIESLYSSKPNFRFCCTLWDWCIAPSALVKDEHVAAKIMAMLQQDGVNTNRLKKLNNFSDVQAIKKATFDGQGCDKVLARFDDYLVASQSSFRTLG